MSVVRDIFEAYRHPQAVFGRRLGQGQREDRAIALLIVACLLLFVSQWPRLQREALETGAEFQMLAGGALFGWLFLMPLLAYLMGAISHLVARPMGGKGSWFTARVALFWAMLVASPLWLLSGLISGIAGQGVLTNIAGIVALAAFVVHWSLNLWVAERGNP